jgi:pilus assembly protein Flp/PilA
MKSLSSKSKQEKGQGLVEYALILVLVAIVVIAALMVLGPKIGNIFSKVNSSLTTVSSGGAAVSACVQQTVNNNSLAQCDALMISNHCASYTYSGSFGNTTCTTHD